MLLLVIHHLCRHRHPQVGHEAQHPHDVLVLLVGDGTEEGAAVLLLHLGELFERLDVAAPAVEVLQHVLLNVGQLQQGALLVPQRLKAREINYRIDSTNKRKWYDLRNFRLVLFIIKKDRQRTMPRFKMPLTLWFFPLAALLKGQCHEIFCFWFFS